MHLELNSTWAGDIDVLVIAHPKSGLFGTADFFAHPAGLTCCTTKKCAQAREDASARIAKPRQHPVGAEVAHQRAHRMAVIFTQGNGGHARDALNRIENSATNSPRNAGFLLAVRSRPGPFQPLQIAAAQLVRGDNLLLS